MATFKDLLIEYYQEGKTWYHATNKHFDKFDTTLGDLGAHFGSKDQAQHVLKNRLSGEGHIYKARIKVYNPLRLTDVGSFHADNIADQLLKKKLISKDEHDKYTHNEAYKHRKQYNQEIRQRLIDKGYDGVSYSNTHEGRGTSLIAFDPESIKMTGLMESAEEQKKLRSYAYSQKSMLERGADGHLSSAYERYVPMHKLDGLEPTPTNNESDDGKYHYGKPVKQPIEVKYDADEDKYTVYGGNHRIAQAKANGDTHILAFVEPDRRYGTFIGKETLDKKPVGTL